MRDASQRQEASTTPRTKSAVRQNGAATFSLFEDGWATRIPGRATRAPTPQAKAFGRIPENCPLGSFLNGIPPHRFESWQHKTCSIAAVTNLYAFRCLKMAGPPGFEPGLRAPKTPVLPLHHGPVRKRRAEPVLEKSVVGREGIEPAALGLKVPCSTS